MGFANRKRVGRTRQAPRCRIGETLAISRKSDIDVLVRSRPNRRRTQSSPPHFPEADMFSRGATLVASALWLLAPWLVAWPRGRYSWFCTWRCIPGEV